jgi:hypothetical protein
MKKQPAEKPSSAKPDIIPPPQKPLKQFSRDDIVAKLKSKIIPVEIPEWGAVITVRTIPFDQMIQMKTQYPLDGDFRAALMITCCADLSEDDVRTMKEGDGFQFSVLYKRVYAVLDASIAPGN